MGTLIQSTKTIPMPNGATVKNGIVTWTVKGKTRTGKITKNGKVTVQVDTWTAQYTDENGEVRRVSTKTKNRSIAERILANYVAEVERIRGGIMTREELEKVVAKNVSLDDAVEKFRTKMIASGVTERLLRN